MTNRMHLTRDELTKYIDALFYPLSEDDEGYVEMIASPSGRDLINSLFPRGQIAWRKAEEGWPSDWGFFSINLAEVVANIPTKLALDTMPPGMTVDDCNGDGRAFLLAYSVKRAGGRAGRVQREPLGIELHIPATN